MKRFLVPFVAVAFLAALPALAYGQISGSAHDFSGETWNPGGQICIVCHATHNNVATVANAPLWNHDTTSATFAVYSSPTLDAGPLGQPAGISKLCLSCHDGTVALDAFGGSAGGAEYISGNDSLGVDLSNDHPISFAYTAGLDPELYDPTTQASGLGGTIDADMLFSTQLECASCHDVHRRPGGGAPLLVKSNATSALCLTCHNK